MQHDDNDFCRCAEAYFPSRCAESVADDDGDAGRVAAQSGAEALPVVRRQNGREEPEKRHLPAMQVPGQSHVGVADVDVFGIVGRVCQQDHEVAVGQCVGGRRCGLDAAERVVRSGNGDVRAVFFDQARVVVEQMHSERVDCGRNQLSATLIVVVAHHCKRAVGWGAECKRLEKRPHEFAALLIVAAKQQRVGCEVGKGQAEGLQLPVVEATAIMNIGCERHAESVESCRNLRRPDVVLADSRNAGIFPVGPQPAALDPGLRRCQSRRRDQQCGHHRES